MNPKKESQPATESTLRRFIRQMPGSSSGGRSCFALRGNGVGLISAFAAREVFVSALALMYNIDDGGNANVNKSLISAMKEATFPDGARIFTTASVVGILIFFMIALQCTSTVGILRRETGSWTPALLQLVLSNMVAYGLAVGAVNLLKAFGL